MQLTLSKPWRAREWRLPLGWYRRLTVFTAFCVWALIVLGGAVRVTDSGTGCGESWPLCQGRLLPSLEYHQLVEWNHRLFATLVGLLMVVTVGSTLLWYRKPRRLAVLAILAAATYLGQAILGGITVLLHLDQTWVAAHMGNSMILLASVTLLALFARISEYREPSTEYQVPSTELSIDDRRWPVSRFTFHVSRSCQSPAVLRPSSFVGTRYSVLGTWLSPRLSRPTPPC